LDEVSQDLSAAYLEADRRQRVLHSKIGCVLALVLMPPGASLDFFVYPEQFWAFFGARMLCDVGVLIVLATLYTKFGEKHIRVLGVLWALLPGAAISWMIYRIDGVESLYYAGLNLVIIAVSLKMPWTMWEVLTTCGFTLLFYVFAVTGHSLYLDKSLLVNDTGRGPAGAPSGATSTAKSAAMPRSITRPIFVTLRGYVSTKAIPIGRSRPPTRPRVAASKSNRARPTSRATAGWCSTGRRTQR
jgi:hypothetical protein